MKAIMFGVTFRAIITGLIWILGIGVEADMSKFKLVNYSLCKDAPAPKIQLFIQPKNFNTGIQLVAMNLSFPIPIGNDVSMKILFEVDTPVLNKHVWITLIEVEGDFCKLFDRYGGELWYDMERRFGIMPHSCPLPRGSYHADNFLMDYQKLKLQTFPFGNIRITINFVHKIHLELRGCYTAIVNNGVE